MRFRELLRNTSIYNKRIEEYGVRTMEDVHNFVKMLMAQTIQTALDAELESELGYSKNSAGQHGGAGNQRPPGTERANLSRNL
jgi:transposase-like protein